MRLVLIGSLVLLVCSCVVAVDDTGETAEDIHGTGSLANMPPGPCATACLGLAEHECGRDWKTLCENDYPDDEAVTCGDVDLTCEEAKAAAEETPFGVMWCYRSCEGLH